MKQTNDNVSNFLNDFKSKAELSISELVSITGIAQSSLYEYLKYEREPTISNLIKVHKSLNISADLLLNWSNLNINEKDEILENLVKDIPDLKFKHFIKSNISNFFKDKRIPMYSKEEIYVLTKDLYYEEKRKNDVI